jgi:uncharacterized protein YqhQ
MKNDDYDIDAINKEKREENLKQFEEKYQKNNNEEKSPKANNTIVTLGDWIVIIILTAIPFVNIIMLLVWSFSSSTPTSKKNYARAQLILIAIVFILMLIFGSSITSYINGTPANSTAL